MTERTTTHIRIEKKTKKALNSIRKKKRETYDDIIQEMLGYL